MATTHPQNQPNPHEHEMRPVHENTLPQEISTPGDTLDAVRSVEHSGFSRFLHSKVGKAAAAFAGLALAAGAYTAVKGGESEKAIAQPVASASPSPSETASSESTPIQSVETSPSATALPSETATQPSSPEAVDPKATAGIITTEAGQTEIVNYATPFLVEAKGDTAEFGKPVVDAWFKAYQSLLVPSEATNMSPDGSGDPSLDYDKVLNDFKGLLDANTWQHADSEFETQRNLAPYNQNGLVGFTNNLITTIGSLSTEVTNVYIEEHEVGNQAAVQFKISTTNSTGDHEVTQLFKLSFAKAELQKTDGTKSEIWQVNSYQYSPVE